MIIVDGHCDTIKEAYKRKISLDNKGLHFNITECKTPTIQMFAIYISPEEKEKGFEIAEKVINKFRKEQSKFSDKIVQIYSKQNIEKIKENQLGVILTTENGSVIQGDLSNIDKLYNEGVRMMSVVWNEDNSLASGALTKEDKGLTNLGIEYIKYLNKKNILIDVSHSSEKTFWDVSKTSNKPIVASHSCVYNLCHHPRNLKDEQIKQIAKMNGIIGIVFCNSFLCDSGNANVYDIVKHIKYIKDLVGIDYVGLGSDFDGLEKEHIMTDIVDIKDTSKLITALQEEGFNKTEIEKIMGENWLRVIKENLI